MLNRLNRAHAFCFVVALLLGLPAGAQDTSKAGVLTLEGQNFPTRVVVAGADLKLNGTGLRAVAWFKAYAAALYLPELTDSASRATSMPGAKRLQLRMLQEAPTVEFVKAIKKGVARNSTAAEQAQLAPALQRFEEQILAVGKVRKGDVIDLDLHPARGMLFTLNGTLRGEPLQGPELFAALLLSFVGDKPYDDKLKAGLLGKAR
jgi:Chalcone isomerase-like